MKQYMEEACHEGECHMGSNRKTFSASAAGLLCFCSKKKEKKALKHFL
jgi:hypothetical protein